MAYSAHIGNPSRHKQQLHERSGEVDVIVILLLLVAALVLFDVLAVAFGTDSRDSIGDAHAGNQFRGAV
jgi:hypothetical protein